MENQNENVIKTKEPGKSTRIPGISDELVGRRNMWATILCY